MPRSRVLASFAVLAAMLLSSCLHAVRKDPLTGAAVPDDFPGAVFVKTPTRTFNSFFFYALDRDGRIWMKSIPGASKETDAVAPDWQLVLGTGLPHDQSRKDFANPKRIESINADQDELMAVSDEHRHYSVRWFADPVFKEDTPPKVWADLSGWPVKAPYVWDARVAHNRGWAVGRRTRTYTVFEDPTGRTFDGGGGLSTYYFLAPDGTQVDFADSGLPADFSHTLCGPDRSTFVAESLEVAGDTMFVINAYGEMETRNADFDTSGSDSMFFVYTYDRAHPPKDAIALPGEGWFAHKPIPLTGQAQISTEIALVLTGKHNRDRELRVAGYDQDRRPGYYAKRIFTQAEGSPDRVDSDSWTFHPVAELAIDPMSLLDPADTDPDATRRATRTPEPTPRWQSQPKPPRRVPARNMAFSGELSVDGKVVPVTVSVADFNLECAPATLRLTAGSDSVDVTLHTVEKWFHLKRFDPGHDGTPKEFLATIEIPAAARATTNPLLKDVVERLLAPHDLKPFAFYAQGTEDYLELESRAAEPGPKLALYLGRDGRAYPSFATARHDALRHDAFTKEARAAEYTVGKPLDALTAADAPKLEDAIRRNEKLEKELAVEADSLVTQDKRTPKWLSPTVLGALKVMSGPNAIEFIVPALPFRNVTNAEASYYAGNLTRSMPPLLRRSRAVRDELVAFAHQDLDRARTIIDARREAYGLELDRLHGRKAKPFVFHDDLASYWQPFRFGAKDATLRPLHDATPLVGCRANVDDHALFDPSARAVFGRRAGPAGFFVNVTCAGEGHENKLLLRVVPTRAELDFLHESLANAAPLGSADHPLSTPVEVEVEAADASTQTAAVLDALFPSSKARADEDVAATLTVAGAAMKIADADFELAWQR